MAVTQIHGQRQIKQGTIDVDRLQDNFLQGVTWQVSSDNSAKITGLAGPSSPQDAVNKEYVDGLFNASMQAPDGYATNTNGDYPSDYKGTGEVKEGNSFYITDVSNGNTVGSKTVNVGDMLIALVDNPGNVDSNWLIVESNRDQATETVKGVARIATQSEVDAGTNDTTIVTPLKLKTTLNNAGITEIVAGNGLTETTSGGTKTIDIVAEDSSIKVNPDSIQVQVGNSNGASLEVTSTGLELVQDVQGTRQFSPGSGNSFTINADTNKALLTNNPDGTVDLAIATVKYVNDNISDLGTPVYNELPTVTDGSTDVTLANAPRANTERVYLNGIRQAPGSGNDYTISGDTITFANALQSGDVVLVDYIY